MLAPPHWHFRDTRERLEAHMGGPQNQDERWLREMGVRPPIFIRWISGWSDTTMNELTEGKICKWLKWAHWIWVDDLFNIKDLEIAQAIGRLGLCGRWFCNMYHITVLWHFWAQWPRRPSGRGKTNPHAQAKKREWEWDNVFRWMKNLFGKRMYVLNIL